MPLPFYGKRALVERLKMGKIVKFCSSCDEGFAEKFGFCPNCGETLQAFEMNPLAVAPFEEEAPVFETNRLVEIEAARPEVVQEIAEPIVEEPFEGVETVELPKRKASAPRPYYQSTPVDVDRNAPVSHATRHTSDGEFYVTVIEEKNVGQRNALLLGTLGLMIVSLLAGLVINLFTKDLKVGSINDDIFLASLIDDVPMDIKEELEKKDKDDGGGGGGGGRDEEEPVTKGDLADQTEKPVRAPDAKIPRLDDPLLMDPASTQGNRKFPKEHDRFGDPNSAFSNFSNGPGSGGGQGTGTGTGQGSGRGTGAGSGDGSGSGGGSGDGNGDGTGSGGGSPRTPPPAIVRVTTPWRLISKPRPGYTDAARTNNVQGTVVLRVVFLASGQVGSVTAVKGLPNGLTEQAISAARRINFEPMKVNGVAQNTSKTIEYSFSIY